VAFSIDTSAPFLRPSQLEALVVAVRDEADKNDEHDWVEWKSTLDLTIAADRWHLAKQILGFSNRAIATSKRHAGGYSYVLVGVEPGALAGVTTIDNADLVNPLNRWVGPARWSPEQVVVDGKTVMVIVVDPPQPGDDPFTLRKAYDQFNEGAIFVRTPGRTDRATSAQITDLMARARAGTAVVQVVVRAEPATVEFGPAYDAQRAQEWLAERRTELMLPSRSKWPATKPSPYAALRQFDRGLVMPATSVYGLGEQPDKRTEEDYEREVEEYLAKAEETVRDHLLHQRYESDGATLRLVVDNPTDRNFQKLVVTAHVHGDVVKWPSSVGVRVYAAPNWPAVPAVLGTPRKLPGIERLLNPAALYPRAADRAIVNPIPRFEIEDTGSVTITYAAVDIRPRTPTALPAVAVMVREPAGTILRVEWTATAENVDGKIEGELGVEVVSQPDYYASLPGGPGAARGQ
jgi:hypothetical protein